MEPRPMNAFDLHASIQSFESSHGHRWERDSLGQIVYHLSASEDAAFCCRCTICGALMPITEDAPPKVDPCLLKPVDQVKRSYPEMH